MLIAAVHESAIGTKRTIAALQQFVRYWTNNGQSRVLVGDCLSANNPKRTSARFYAPGSMRNDGLLQAFGLK